MLFIIFIIIYAADKVEFESESENRLQDRLLFICIRGGSTICSDFVIVVVVVVAAGKTHKSCSSHTPGPQVNNLSRSAVNRFQRANHTN